HEHRGADQFTGADIAHSMAGCLQTNRHVDHRALVRHQQKPAQARRIVELVIALIIDPGCNPASTKSVNPEIFGQALTPTRLSLAAVTSPLTPHVQHAHDAIFKQPNGYASSISPRDAPEVCMSFVPLKTEGAGKAGCPMHPQPHVQK